MNKMTLPKHVVIYILLQLRSSYFVCLIMYIILSIDLEISYALLDFFRALFYRFIRKYNKKLPRIPYNTSN